MNINDLIWETLKNAGWVIYAYPEQTWAEKPYFSVKLGIYVTVNIRVTRPDSEGNFHIEPKYVSEGRNVLVPPLTMMNSAMDTNTTVEKVDVMMNLIEKTMNEKMNWRN